MVVITKGKQTLCDLCVLVRVGLIGGGVLQSLLNRRPWRRKKDTIRSVRRMVALVTRSTANIIISFHSTIR
jgi:hypothetical protein